MLGTCFSINSLLPFERFLGLVLGRDGGEFDLIWVFFFKWLYICVRDREIVTQST